MKSDASFCDERPAFQFISRAKKLQLAFLQLEGRVEHSRVARGSRVRPPVLRHAARDDRLRGGHGEGRRALES